MRTYDSLNFISDTPTVCALGCFDGIHVGHASIIGKARSIAAEISAKCAVWSFAEPPRNYFATEKIPLITTAEEKKLQMKKLGVDIFVSIPFTKEISSMPAEDFFNSVLLGIMKAKHLVCGFNYRFGKGGEGTPELLARLCEKNGIGLSVIEPVTVNGTTASSSEIRAALLAGQADTAALYLGRPYSLRAKIVSGQQLGRTLGFPTVNQSFPVGKLVPKNGVYVSRITFDKKTKYGITNVGIRPTVDGKTLCAETNLFDFEGDLYEKTLTVEFLQFIRSEQKFDSIASLTKQVNADISKAKEILKKHAI